MTARVTPAGAGAPGELAAPAPRSRLRRGLRAGTTGVFVVAVAAGVAVALRGQDWSALASLVRPGALPSLLGALLASAVGLLYGTWSWRTTLAALGSPVPVRYGTRMFFIGFLGKFLPGRVWGLVAQMRMAERIGITRTQLTAGYLVNLVVVLLTGCTVGLLAAPSILKATISWLALPAVLVITLTARPHLLDHLVTPIARLTRRPAPTRRATPADVRRSLGYQTLSWLLSGVHVWVIATLLGAPAAGSFAVAVGGFALAAVAGTLAIFVPDGAGVREVVLVACLATVLPLPAAITASVASRVLSTLAEVLTSGGALLFCSRPHHPVTIRTGKGTPHVQPAHLA